MFLTSYFQKMENDAQIIFYSFFSIKSHVSNVVTPEVGLYRTITKRWFFLLISLILHFYSEYLFTQAQ